MSSAPIAAFDADSPDARILGAFERVRALRTHHYSFDGAPPDPARDAQFEADDVQMMADESIVHGDFANTIPGVAARLMLLIPALDNCRWVDAGLMSQGFRALHREVDGLDGHAQQVSHAIDELLHIEWNTALAAYEESAIDFELARKGKGLAEAAARKLSDIGCEIPIFAKLEAFFDETEDRFSNGAEIVRLFKTLTPDHDAFQRKVEIAIAEGHQEDAFPWLARDTFFLAGRVDRAAPAGGASDEQ